MMKNSLHQKNLESQTPLTRKPIFEGKFFRLERQTLQFEKAPHDWDIIFHPGAVAILPIHSNGKLILIQQWRRAIEKIIYEIPAGLLNPGEIPIECAQRELQEEIGYKADILLPFGGFYSAPGFCSEFIHLFLAQDLSCSSLPKDEHEAIDVLEISLEDALSLIDSGEIQDGKTICSILRYKRLLRDRCVDSL